MGPLKNGLIGLCGNNEKLPGDAVDRRRDDNQTKPTVKRLKLTVNEENFQLSEKTGDPDPHTAALSEVSRQREALRVELQASQQLQEELRIGLETANQEKLKLMNSLQAHAVRGKVLEETLAKRKSSDIQSSNRLAELQAANEKLKRENEAKDVRHLGLVAESKSFITAKRDLEKHLDKHKTALSKLAQLEAELKQNKRERKQDALNLAQATKQLSHWEKQSQQATAENETLAQDFKDVNSELKAAKKSNEKISKQFDRQNSLLEKAKLKASADAENHKQHLAKVKSGLMTKLEDKDQTIRELKLRLSSKSKSISTTTRKSDKAKPAKKPKASKVVGKAKAKPKAAKKASKSKTGSLGAGRKKAKKKR